MALTKETVQSHNIRGRFKTISEITDTYILNNGARISDSRHRGGVLYPGSLADGVYVRTDTTGYSDDVQALAAACWTDAIHEAYETSLNA
ncbi:MAG: hypothetical protein K0U41_06980 [Gammaproteobacteria bacterium]|nr:hypothetical protein [Gammaproteobacteria bacterium]